MGHPGSILADETFGTLLSQARADGRLARAALLETWRGALEGHAARAIPPVLRGKADATDLVQEALWQAYEHFSQFHGTSAEGLRRWLFGILHHVVGHFKRGYGVGSKREVSREVDFRHVEAEGKLVARDASPPAAAIAHEDQDRARCLVAGLGPEAQAVLRWRYEDGLPWAEIGQLAACSGAAARKRERRAIKHLRLAAAGPALTPAPVSPATAQPDLCTCRAAEYGWASRVTLAAEPLAVAGTMTYDPGSRPARECADAAAAAPQGRALPGATAAEGECMHLVTMMYDTGATAGSTEAPRRLPPKAD
jgi:RNA polymerase sigma factor (sigma-70 family)